MEQSLKERIIRYYQSRRGDWVHKGDIQDLAKQKGYSYENTGRRLRELHDEGYLDCNQPIRNSQWNHNEGCMESGKRSVSYRSAEKSRQAVLITQ